jgi:orotate phosphoribosyltransferase
MPNIPPNAHLNSPEKSEAKKQDKIPHNSKILSSGCQNQIYIQAAITICHGSFTNLIKSALIHQPF